VTHISPCFRCPIREGCEHKASLVKRCARLGAVSIKFRCDILRAAMRVGRRIEISVPHVVVTSNYESEGYSRNGSRLISATITAVLPNYKFRCTVDPHCHDDEEGEREWEKMRFRRYKPHYRIIRFLEEPDLKVCESGNVQRDGKCDFLPDSPDAICWCESTKRSMREMEMYR
jgi:hypothetical protein